MRSSFLWVCGIIIVLVFGGWWASHLQRVKPGYVAVKVYLLGGSKGVDYEELGVGRYWVGLN